MRKVLSAPSPHLYGGRDCINRLGWERENVIAMFPVEKMYYESFWIKSQDYIGIYSRVKMTLWALDDSCEGHGATPLARASPPGGQHFQCLEMIATFASIQYPTNHPVTQMKPTLCIFTDFEIQSAIFCRQMALTPESRGPPRAPDPEVTSARSATRPS
jgi:hypothetical protein